jgi:hypothetical protein
MSVLDVTQVGKRTLHCAGQISSMVHELRVSQVEALPWVERQEDTTGVDVSADSSFRQGQFLDARSQLRQN